MCFLSTYSTNVMSCFSLNSAKTQQTIEIPDDNNRSICNLPPEFDKANLIACFLYSAE